jgi:hypothetical protein
MSLAALGNVIVAGSGFNKIKGLGLHVAQVLLRKVQAKIVPSL